MQKTPHKCEVCGRPAKHHETSLDAGVALEQHFCGIHARQEFLAAFKDVLSSQVTQFPVEWRAANDTDSQLKERISNASSLSEIGGMIRLDVMAERFRQDPPAV